MSDLVSKAREALETRLSEITAEQMQLEGALKSLRPLGRSSGTGRQVKGASRRRRASRARSGPSKEVVKAVTEYLTANPGAETAEVVSALGLKDGRVVGAQRRKLSS